VLTKKTFDQTYNLDYNKFFTMVQHVGDDLNSRKNRFDKADLFEAAISVMTGEKLKWEDKIGYDLINPKTQEKFEFKSQKNCLYTRTGKRKKSHTSNIKLTNTLTKNKNKELKSTADYLIIADTASFAMAIIPYYDVVEKYSHEKSDGWECQIPLDKLLFLFVPSDFVRSPNMKGIETYAVTKARAQKEYVEMFK